MPPEEIHNIPQTRFLFKDFILKSNEYLVNRIWSLDFFLACLHLLRQDFTSIGP